VETLVDDYSRILNHDKLSFDYIVRGFGLPMPEIFAVYAPQPRPGAFSKLTSVAELRDFLMGSVKRAASSSTLTVRLPLGNARSSTQPSTWKLWLPLPPHDGLQ
jgi:hypothetical protein